MKKTIATLSLIDRLFAATREYRDRQSRRTHPEGTFDDAGRFYLATEERCSCCRGIRSPSRAWPYPEMKHGRSVDHVAELFDVPVGLLRRFARAADAGHLEEFAADAAVKIAAVDAGEALASIPRLTWELRPVERLALAVASDQRRAA